MADHVKSRLEMDIERAAALGVLNEKERQREQAFMDDMAKKMKERNDAQIKEQLQQDIAQSFYEAEKAARERSVQRHGSNPTNDSSKRALQKFAADVFKTEPAENQSATDAAPLLDPKEEAEKNALRKLLESL